METLFESETCGRCAGTGHYSRNAQGSTRCYGCGGAKVILTKTGKKAQFKMFELQTRPASTVKVGHQIRYEPYLGRARWVWVNEVIDRGDDYCIDILHVHGAMVTTKNAMVRTVRDEADRQETIAAALAYQAKLIAAREKRAAKLKEKQACAQ